MKRLLLILISAALVVLSFPPHDLGFLAWVALVPLLAAIRGESPLKSFLYCYLFGGIMLMGVYSWINTIRWFSPFYFLMLAVYLGAYYALFGLLLNWILPVLRWSPLMIAPSLWVVMEFLRSNAGFVALPWPNLGNSQYEALSVIQIASVAGVYGVSFLVVTVNAAIGEIVSGTIRTKNHGDHGVPRGLLKPAAIALVCLGTTLAFGRAVMDREAGGGNAIVSVIQGNIPQGRKWDPRFRDAVLAKHLELSEAAIKSDRAALIVWPETAVSGSLPTDQVLFRAFSGLTRKSDAYLLVGNAAIPKIRFKEGRTRIGTMYNSAFLFSPQGAIVNKYDKIHLLPFGEYLPYRDGFPWPSALKSSVDVEFSPGRTHTVFLLDGIPFSASICWENMFPDLFRNFVKKGARFMVNITNEAWFGDSAAPYQFLAMSVFRAVENRIAVIRCANTGVSCFISPRGEIYGRVTVDNRDIQVEGYSTRKVDLREGTTFYTRHGDLFAWGNILLTFLLVFGRAILRDAESNERDGTAA